VINFRFLLICYIAIVTSVSCRDNNETDSNFEPFSNAGSLNGELAGHIVLGGILDGWILDLTTGDYTRIPGLELWDENPNYLGIASVTAFPVAFNNSEIIETVEACHHIENKIRSGNCIKIYNQNGDLIKHVNYGGSIVASAKLSTDQTSEYIALARQYGDLATNTYLEIHDRSGNLVSENIIDDTYAPISFDWLPNNALVYTFEHSIYLTTALSTSGVSIIEFTSSEGKPKDIVVNPDGKQIAFKLVTSGSIGNNFGQIWVIDVDGSNLRQLTSVTDTEIASARDPAWSPDGKWILVASGGFDGISVGNPGSPDILYAIPSDGEKVPLTIIDETSALPILSYNSKIRGDKTPELSYKFQSSGNHAWLP